MLQKNCQVCGNPMFSQDYYGTEADGALNPDFCSNCYKSGHFYDRQSSDDTFPPIAGAAMPWAVYSGRGF